MVAKKQRYWDGVQRVYIPPEHLDISPKLEMQRECVSEKDIDPITFEVLRHRLWKAVWDAVMLAAKLCVSPISFLTRDMNSTLSIEDGEIVYIGPYMHYMGVNSELAIKWTLENRSDMPGINPGDIFVANDPWIAGAHQQDVSIYAPIFVGDELFCWAGIGQHQNDVGGSVPSSFCMNATDIFLDPQPVPPLKIVSGGKIDPQILDLYKRLSRTPVHMELDFKAAAAGLNLVREGIEEVVEEYGVKVVKGVMRGIIDRSEAEFRRVLSSIPNGTWRAHFLIQAEISRSRKCHRFAVTMRKEGTDLYFSNEDSDPQTGVINSTFANWVGSTCGITIVGIMASHIGAAGGAKRCMHFEPISGKLICPEYGVAVSPSGMIQGPLNQSIATVLLSKMFTCSWDPEVKKYALSAPIGSWPSFAGNGVTRAGEWYIAMLCLDNNLGAGSATPFQDGVHGAGVSFIPEGPAANNEENERDFPILTIYRKEEMGELGIGKFCSGTGTLVLMTPHRGTMAPVLCVAEEVPNTPTLFGYPGNRHRDIIMLKTNLKDLFEKSQVPLSIDELKGERVAEGISRAIVVGEITDDLGECEGVVQWATHTPSGFGDPLVRDPAFVREDVAKRRYSREDGERFFGVVLKDDLSVDEEQTKKKRDAIRRQRLARSRIIRSRK